MNISIDSNALTYLIEAIDPNYDPLNDELSNYLQRVSMLRIFLYGGLRCGILPQVFKEMGDISEHKWKETHESTAGVLFHEVTPKCLELDLKQRKEELLKTHPKEKDCTLLAEAEFAGINVLLTRDVKFRNRLNPLSIVEIIFPSDYLDLLSIEKDTKPKFCPDKSNPLFGKSWWKIQ
jgi:predicted nucleic acid-binding protein